MLLVYFSVFCKTKLGILSCLRVNVHSISFQVLALENNVMELQMFLDKAQADLAAAKEELDIMETEHKELADEYIALKTSHVQLTADYQKEVQCTYMH